MPLLFYVFKGHANKISFGNYHLSVKKIIFGFQKQHIIHTFAAIF